MSEGTVEVIKAFLAMAGGIGVAYFAHAYKQGKDQKALPKPTRLDNVYDGFEGLIKGLQAEIARKDKIIEAYEIQIQLKDKIIENLKDENREWEIKCQNYESQIEAMKRDLSPRTASL